MKYLLAIFVFVLLAGCARDPEDKPFFNQGWWKPEAGAEKRMNTDSF